MAARRALPRAGRQAPIEIVDRFRPRTSTELVRRAVRAARAHGQRPELRVHVLLTDDAEIAGLHGQFLGDPTPTDVMSFPGEDALDVVVSVECARREAARRGHPIRAEVALYLVHGVLHACGFDDRTAAQRARMRTAEHTVLAQLGLSIDR